MSLKTFIQINEGEYANKATLIYQAFIDNLETAHYNKQDGSMSFNIGKAAKIAKFADLELVLRESPKMNVRLAKRKNSDNYAIVVDMPEIPNINELEAKLESPKIMRPAVEAIESYLEYKRKSPTDSDYLTDYEKTKRYNEKEVFEEHYQKLIEKLREKYSELEKMISNFEEQKEQTGNSSRKVTLDMAIDKLKNDYLGKTYKEFSSKAYSILDEINPDFRENMDKDHKNILDSRLKDFYEELQ